MPASRDAVTVCLRIYARRHDKVTPPIRCTSLIDGDIGIRRLMSRQQPPSLMRGCCALWARLLCMSYATSELAAVAEATQRCLDRVAAIATGDTKLREDVQAAVYEAERGLLNAHRLVLRAAKASALADK